MISCPAVGLGALWTLARANRLQRLCDRGSEPNATSFERSFPSRRLCDVTRKSEGGAVEVPRHPSGQALHQPTGEHASCVQMLTTWSLATHQLHVWSDCTLGLTWMAGKRGSRAAVALPAALCRLGIGAEWISCCRGGGCSGSSFSPGCSRACPSPERYDRRPWEAAQPAKQLSMQSKHKEKAADAAQELRKPH